MHPFCNGELVICINDKPMLGREPPRDSPWIKAGRAYRVKGILQETDVHWTRYGIELEEIPSPLSCGGWQYWRFRKIERADDCFIDAMRSLQANILFKEAVQQTVVWHRRRWAAPSGFMQGRAEHVTRLLTGYGEWYRNVFACYPDAEHIRDVAGRMITWRSGPIDGIKSMNPWIVPADYPALCRTTLPDRTRTIMGGSYA